MPSIVGPREGRAVKKLSFCYACGGALEFGAASDDHVPPKSCVAQLDRANSPLILPSHTTCNGSFSHGDERVGQFLSLLHGRRVSSDKSLLKFSQVNADHMALPSVDLYSTIWRWLRAFHAALYWQPLDAKSKYAIELPCSVFTPGPSGITLDSGRPRQRKLCQETLQRNRDARNIDRIAAWNGCLRYECVWQSTPINACCVLWLERDRQRTRDIVA